MARMGPMPKHPAKRVGHSPETTQLAVVRGDSFEWPKPQKQWLKVTRDDYAAYQNSPVAAIVGVEDLPIIRRPFSLRDDHERCARAARKDPLVTGSQGQKVENPLAKRADRIMGEITRLEDKLGMNPVARMRLAISTADAQQSADEMARKAYGSSRWDVADD